MFGHNFFAIAVTEANLYLPLMIIPIYMSVERMDMSIVQAAISLGSRPLRTCSVALSSAFVTGDLDRLHFRLPPGHRDVRRPALVGGPSDIMYGNSSPRSSASPTTGHWARRWRSSSSSC